MADELRLALAELHQKERKLLKAPAWTAPIKESLYPKIPKQVYTALTAAFEKSFRMLFIHGSSILEKTISMQEISQKLSLHELQMELFPNRKTLRLHSRQVKQSLAGGNAFAVLSGAGLGLLGFGLPDIPLFTALLLRCMLKTAAQYGIDWHSTQEQCYLLRLMRTALSHGDSRRVANLYLERTFSEPDLQLEQEISRTSAVLAQSLLAEKFVQGMPLIGTVGAAVNHVVYRKIAAWSCVKYQKRYLLQQIQLREQKNICPV